MNIIFGLHELSHEIDCLTSLVLVMIDRIEQVSDHVDPEQSAKVAADLARIAFDGLVVIVAKLGALENAATAVSPAWSSSGLNGSAPS
jgi:hypothetical protein